MVCDPRVAAIAPMTRAFVDTTNPIFLIEDEADSLVPGFYKASLVAKQRTRRRNDLSENNRYPNFLGYRRQPAPSKLASSGLRDDAS